jgi:four helix bundle protein
MVKKQYRVLKKFHLHPSIENQLRRASLSVCLNLAEGTAKSGLRDRKRFFNIAYTSQKEVQMIIELEEINQAKDIANQIAAQLYRLQQNAPTKPVT